MCAPTENSTNGRANQHKQGRVFAECAQNCAYNIDCSRQVCWVEAVAATQFKKIFNAFFHHKSSEWFPGTRVRHRVLL